LSAERITRHTSLHMGDAASARHHRLPTCGRRAVWAVQACRTARLGGHVHTCPEGQVARVGYHACRHRLCPPWAGLQVERRLAQPQARLLAGDHDQAICTVPHERKALGLAHGCVMTPRRCVSGHDTLSELLGDATYLGARPGVIATRHPWRQTLRLHPPVHGLVTGGACARRARGAKNVRDFLDFAHSLLSTDIQARGFEMVLFGPDEERIYGNTLLRTVRSMAAKPTDGDGEKAIELFITRECSIAERY
jgi:Transposase zinc-binding domain